MTLIPFVRHVAESNEAFQMFPDQELSTETLANLGEERVELTRSRFIRAK